MALPKRKTAFNGFAPMGFTPPKVAPGSVALPEQPAGGALPDFSALLGDVAGIQDRTAVEGALADFEAPKSNWADKLGVLGGMLLDLSQGGGSENTFAARDRWDSHVDELRQRHTAAQAKKLTELAAAGNDFAIRLMDPLGAREFDRAGDWRREDLGREDAGIERDENWRLKQWLNTLGQQDEEKRRFDTSIGEDRRQFDTRLAEERRQFGKTYDQNDREIMSAEAIAALKAGAGSVDDEASLRKEYLSQNKDFQDMQRSIGKIRSLDTTNAPGQMGLIFNIMKLYDPGSTVREGEFANAENARGVPGSVINSYNKLLGGSFLTKDQIEQFKGTAESLYGSAEQDFERSYNTYREQIAPAYGFDVDRTIPDLRQPQRAKIDLVSSTGIEIPAAAVNEMIDSLSPAEMAEFDASFGAGSAAKILEQLGIDPPEQPVPRAYDVPR